MVRKQLRARGITDRRVLAAMAAVPRQQFVPRHLVDKAYADVPLPIAAQQTISQPFMVALMTLEAQLGRRSRVLEVGTGTGYHTAVLAKIAGHVWSVERLRELSTTAASRLAELGVDNATLVIGDGALGHPAGAPYDAIIVAAAAPQPPRALLDQLAEGGRLVIPIGDQAEQMLCILQRRGDRFHERLAGGCRFVPLVSPAAFRGGP